MVDIRNDLNIKAVHKVGIAVGKEVAAYWF